MSRQRVAPAVWVVLALLFVLPAVWWWGLGGAGAGIGLGDVRSADTVAPLTGDVPALGPAHGPTDDDPTAVEALGLADEPEVVEQAFDRRLFGVVSLPDGRVAVDVELQLFVDGAVRDATTCDGNGRYELGWSGAWSDRPAWLFARPADGARLVEPVALAGRRVRHDLQVRAGPQWASLRLTEPRWDGLPLELQLVSWRDDLGRELDASVVAWLDAQLEWELVGAQDIPLDILARGRGVLAVRDRVDIEARVEVSAGDERVPVELPRVGPLEVVVRDGRGRVAEGALVLCSDQPAPEGGFEPLWDGERPEWRFGKYPVGLAQTPDVRFGRTDENGRVILEGLRVEQALRLHVVCVGEQPHFATLEPLQRFVKVDLREGEFWHLRVDSDEGDPLTEPLEGIEATLTFSVRADRPQFAELLAVPPMQFGRDLMIPLETRDWLDVQVDAVGHWPRTLIGVLVGCHPLQERCSVTLKETNAALELRLTDDLGRVPGGAQVNVRIGGQDLSPLVRGGRARLNDLPPRRASYGVEADGYVAVEGAATLTPYETVSVDVRLDRLGHVRLLGEDLDGCVLEPRRDVSPPERAPASSASRRSPDTLTDSQALFRDLPPGAWWLRSGCEPVPVVVHPGETTEVSLACPARGPWWGQVLVEDRCGAVPRRVRGEDEQGRAVWASCDSMGRFAFEDKARRLTRLRAEAEGGAVGPWLDVAEHDPPVQLELSEACLEIEVFGTWPEGAVLELRADGVAHRVDPRAPRPWLGAPLTPLTAWLVEPGRELSLAQVDPVPGVNTLPVSYPRARLVGRQGRGVDDEVWEHPWEFVLRQDDMVLARSTRTGDELVFAGVPMGRWVISTANPRLIQRHEGEWGDWAVLDVGADDAERDVELVAPFWAKWTLRRGR